MLFVAQTLAFSLNTWTDAAGLSTAMLEEGGGKTYQLQALKAETTGFMMYVLARDAVGGWWGGRGEEKWSERCNPDVCSRGKVERWMGSSFVGRVMGSGEV